MHAGEGGDECGQVRAGIGWQIGDRATDTIWLRIRVGGNINWSITRWSSIQNLLIVDVQLKHFWPRIGLEAPCLLRWRIHILLGSKRKTQNRKYLLWTSSMLCFRTSLFLITNWVQRFDLGFSCMILQGNSNITICFKIAYKVFKIKLINFTVGLKK